MGTVIQAMPHINPGSQQHRDRFERANLFEHYRQLRTQGLSERQAAKELQVPRTTLQAWRLWHDTLDICRNTRIGGTGARTAESTSKNIKWPTP